MRSFGVIQLTTHEDIRKSGWLEKIGFRNQVLYVAPKREDSIEIWAVHRLVPNSWKRLYAQRFIELYYHKYALSYDGNYVFVLVIGHFEAENEPRVTVLRICSVTGAEDRYDLSIESEAEFENVYLDNISLGCGRQGMYLFDRTLIKGQIPFWRISLDEAQKTFRLHNKFIKTDEENKGARFPVVLNSDSRRILKITDRDEVVIYDGPSDTWVKYYPRGDTQLDISSVMSRCLSETYGRAGHRVGAICSPLTVLSDDDQCLFEVHKHGIHTFYKFLFDDMDRTYRLQKMSQIRLRSSLNKSYRLLFADDKVVFVNREIVAFASIQPPTLCELSFWTVQSQFARQNHEGAWHGGKSEAQIREMCALKHDSQLA
ncbi:Protein F56F11.2 [Aphelenchoides avenae]|nr:Protein F56F11.2 [Aphelenchus avenae]